MKQGGYVTLIGFVATEPKIYFTGTGGPMARMRVGATIRVIDRETGEWRDGDTSFFSVTCWRSLASNTTTCLHKGQPVVVTGKLRTSRFEDHSGHQRSEVEIVAETVSVDLNRGVTHFTRTAPAAGAAAAARGEAIRSGLADGDGPADDSPDGDGGDGGNRSQAPGEAAGAGRPARSSAGLGAAEGSGRDMFDDRAVSGLEHELDAPPEEAEVAAS